MILIALLVIIILQQPENPKRLPYMAPCVPFVPASAMLVNIYLMLKLSAITWMRFSIWCFVGKWSSSVIVVFTVGLSGRIHTDGRRVAASKHTQIFKHLSVTFHQSSQSLFH